VRAREAHTHRLSRPGAAALVAAALALGAPAAATAAESVPAPDAAAAAAGLGYRRVSNETTHTVRAMLRRRVHVVSQPGSAGRRLAALRSATFFGTTEVVLVLGVSTGDGGAWSFVRYPGLGDRTGWVRSSALATQPSVSTRIVIDRVRPRVRLFRRGALVFSAPAGVGARQSPTPAGRYYVRERLVPAASNTVYGVLAFGLSAYSRYRTDWPGGGQVGLHGTNEPELIPGHISNGCIRLRNRDVRRLDRLMSVGTPILIR
jgi:hypothetical protein